MLIEDNDRWSREDALTALIELKTVVWRGVTMVIIKSGFLEITKENFYTSNVFLTNIMKSTVAHEENEKKAERVRDGWKTLKDGAAKKIIMTEATPAWWRANKATNQFVPVEPHMSTIKRIFRDYSNGKGIRTIMRELNREQVPSFGRGKQNTGKWSNTHLRRLLNSRNVLGEYQPHKYIRDDKGNRKRIPEGPAIPNYYPSVIEHALFYEVEKRLDQNGHPSGPKDNVTNLFTGFIKCDQCGGSVVIKRDKCRGYNYVSLRCSNGVGNSTRCGYASIQYSWVERAVLTILWSKIVPLMETRDGGRSELEGKQGELGHTQKTLATYRAKLENPELMSDTLLKHIQNLEVREKTLRREVEALAARMQNNPLAGWRPVPNTKDNRLRLQSILSNEVEGVYLNIPKLTGALVVKDPECEFDMQWKRGESNSFSFLGKISPYLDDVLVWESDKNRGREIVIEYTRPVAEAA